MSNYNYAPGAIHLDHHKDLNIDVKSVDDAIRLMSTFMSDRAEDVTPEYTSSPASDNRPKNDFSSVRPESNSDIPLFKYIHPSVIAEDEKRQIHLEIQNLVRHLPLPEICKYLRQMYKQKRVYLNVRTDAMFDELHRMGMPDESNQGFSQKNFQNYFNIND